MAASCLVVTTLVVTVILSINLWNTADGYPACSHSGQDLGECMSVLQCKASGGVIGPNSENRRCFDEADGDEEKVYCTTFAHLAKDLCSTWMPHWQEHDTNCNMAIHERSGFQSQNGEEVKKGEFKHLVAVGRWSDHGRSHKWECGGALISPHYVLTAAHCVSEEEEHEVKLGEYDMSVDSSVEKEVIKMSLPSYLHRSLDYNQTIHKTTVEQILKAKRVIKHPKYSDYSETKQHDLALLELITPVFLNEYVLPACLAFDIDDEPGVGTDLIVAGWGLKLIRGRGSSPSREIRKMNVPVAEGGKCEEFYNAERPSWRDPFTITSDLLCAGAEGLDLCQGDSGGPIGRSMSQQDYPCGAQVLGVSFGHHCKDHGMFTRVSSYIKWIMRYLAPDHYHQHISEEIHSSGLEFDGKSLIHFNINDDIFTNGFKIELDFKTEDPNGILIAIPREGSIISLRVENGQIEFREPFGNVNILSENQYNNGEWYHLTVECIAISQSCYIKISGETLKHSWTLPSRLDVGTAESLIMGGIEEDNISDKSKRFFMGCLVYSSSSSLKLKTAHSSYGTVTSCDSSKFRVNLEDRDAAGRQRLHSEHLQMREKIVSMEQMLLSMSKIINNVHTVTGSQQREQSTHHMEVASEYGGCYPPFINISPTEECVFFGSVLLTLSEAKTNCQIMGAVLATSDDSVKLKAYMLKHDLKALYWVDGKNIGKSCLQFDPSSGGGNINDHSCNEEAKARYICKIADIGGTESASDNSWWK